MEGSVQEVCLKLTNQDKKFIRELIKVRLGVNLPAEEEYETFLPDANSSLITNKNPSESQIQVMKKALIEEAFYQYLKKKSLESANHFQYKEPDINSGLNQKEIMRNENMPEKTDNWSQTDIIGLSQELPVTSKQDIKMGDNLPFIEINDTVAEFIPSTSFIEMNDKSEDVLVIDESYEDMLQLCEERFKPDDGELEEDMQPSTSQLEIRSLNNHTGHKFIPQNNQNVDTNNESYKSPSLPPTHPMLKYSIYSELSNFQRKLSRNALSPTSCLYKLCKKCLWPKPRFSQIHYNEERGFIYNVSVRNTLFKGREWAHDMESAMQLASAECLKHLGFECPYTTTSSTNKSIESPLVNRTDNDFREKNTNDGIGIPFQNYINPKEQYNDKRELEKTSLHGYSDLRLKLIRNRSLGKNISTNE